jgi:hypothetical protein
MFFYNLVDLIFFLHFFVNSLNLSYEIFYIIKLTLFFFFVVVLLKRYHQMCFHKTKICRTLLCAFRFFFSLLRMKFHK